MDAAQKNAHYAKFNAQFRERAHALHGLGYSYRRVEEVGLAVFQKTRCTKVHAVAAALLLYADDVVWADTLEVCMRF